MDWVFKLGGTSIGQYCKFGFDINYIIAAAAISNHGLRLSGVRL